MQFNYGVNGITPSELRGLKITVPVSKHGRSCKFKLKEKGSVLLLLRPSLDDIMLTHIGGAHSLLIQLFTPCRNSLPQFKGTLYQLSTDPLVQLMYKIRCETETSEFSWETWTLERKIRCFDRQDSNF